jgi:O-antigen/teichoic acid export membrane protein
LKTLTSLRSPSVLSNALFIIANTLAGSGLGFVFWFIVARKLLPSEVGVTAALLSALALVGNLSEMGLGITIIRFLSTLREPSKFLNTAATAVGLGLFLYSRQFFLV